MTRQDVTADAVLDAYMQGFNFKQIAEMFRCSDTLVKQRLMSIGEYEPKKIHKAEHGTRTMYVHHGCRCEACCKAEHEQYLKRPEAKLRRRVYSKHGDADCQPRRYDGHWKRQDNKRRYAILGSNPIHWTDIAERFDYRCAICGCDVDPSDTWESQTGRKCFGRNYPTVDHIVPISLGGKDTDDNVQLVCKHCNSKKGTRLEVSA